MSPKNESAPTNLEQAAPTSLEQALTDLPAKMRVHELAKRAGIASKELIAALAAGGVVVASAASSVAAADARAVLTTLLASGEPGPSPTPGIDQALSEPLPDPGFFAAPLFLPPIEAKPARRRGRKAAPDNEPTLPEAAPVVAAPAVSEPAPADLSADHDAAAADGSSRSGRRRRGRSGGRARGAEQASADEPSTIEGEPGTSGPAADLTAPDLGSDVRAEEAPATAEPDEPASEEPASSEEDEAEQAARRRRRRGRRGRGRVGDDKPDDAAESDEPSVDSSDEAVGPAAVDSEETSAPEPDDDETSEEGGTRRRRRRRRRTGTADPVDALKGEDDPDNTVVHVREPRSGNRGDAATSSTSEVQGVRGSTRLEAKRQRRRDSRDSRRRPQILTEAEFLARRESVDRVMAVRQRGDLAQVALLEDGILVEHFVSRAGSESLMGNIYLGRVQNVLPSMEAAFVDIGKGRNAVLYAGEVNWDAAGLAGKARRIETALSGGDTILVQVSKDPVGAKGARLTTQISLPGRFLVYVPGGGATGISRKLPDTERKRLKSILDRIVPEDAGVIIRTAAEGVAEEELARDVERLKSQWEEISRQADKKSNAPQLLSAEPDTLIKVVRDLFNSDISKLILDGDRTYESVSGYIEAVAPELSGRVSRYDGPNDVFSAYRIDEQIAKALERKVYLPSGGSLVIDRTEAMTVIDVNTGKYTGSGGNLEETVTKNNLEAAEEVVRQLRLRDIGGIIVVDFIDMVLESNRELVMRRLTECLGRDRTRHQVAEVTSLGLVQMTRKKMGTGLVEAFSEPCPHCHGRGIILHDVPVQDRSGNHDQGSGDDEKRAGRGRRGRGRQDAAVVEPDPIVKIVPAAVRPPDPRGPKPPAIGHSEDHPDDSGLVPAPGTDGLDVRTSAGVDSDASLNAPRSRDASDAVSAVLAALEGQIARRDVPSTRSPEVIPESAAGSTAEPAAGGRRRGRRAAVRPAGAPSTVTGALGDVVPKPVPEVPVIQQISDPSVQSPVPDQDAVAGAQGGQAGAEPVGAAAAVDAAAANDTAKANDTAPPADNAAVDASTATPRKRQPARRRGKATAAAGAPSDGAAPADETGSGHPLTSRSSDSSAQNGAQPAATTAAQVPGNSASAADAAPAPADASSTKVAPRRRRAATRPAGPAAAPVPAG